MGGFGSGTKPGVQNTRGSSSMRGKAPFVGATRGTERLVKVQLPLIGDVATALVYDEKRSHESQQGIPASIKRALRVSYKGYFYARWSPSSKIWLIDEARGEQPAQDW